MKASKEFSVDLFIKKCIEHRRLTTEREIINRAREVDERRAHLVKELIREGKSEAYNGIEFDDHDCNFCGNAKMFDSEMREYYCPMCD